MSKELHSQSLPSVERKAPSKQPSPSPPAPSKNYFQRLDFSESTDFIGGPQKRSRFKLALWTWVSLTIDHCVVLAFSCLFLIAGKIILKSSFQAIVTFKDFLAVASLVYIFVALMYFTFLRAALGATVGEYSSNLRLGQPSERLRTLYMGKVFLRSLVILLTGVIFMPLASLIVGRDLAGKSQVCHFIL